MFIEKRVVSTNGVLVIPEEVRAKQDIESESTLFRFSWNDSNILVSAGTEILLVDFLIDGEDLVRDAKSLRSSVVDVYSSPLEIFRKNKINKSHGLYMGTRKSGNLMAVFPVGEEAILITPATDAITIYKALPGYPSFDWSRKPDVTPHALAESYESLITRRGLEVVKAFDSSTSITSLPVTNEGLERKVLSSVRTDILNSAVRQFKG